MHRQRVLVWMLAVLLAAPIPGRAETGAGADIARESPSDTEIASAPPVTSAREMPAAIPDATEGSGRVTGFPLPRFVTLKRDRARARRGPGEQWRVDWEFVARGMPLEVVAEFGNWRRVRDIEGHGGWVHYIFLDGRRSAIVTRDMSALRTRPDGGAGERARLEAGVILSVARCASGWCEVETGGADGWVEEGALWGVLPGESFD